MDSSDGTDFIPSTADAGGKYIAIYGTDMYGFFK